MNKYDVIFSDGFIIQIRAENDFQFLDYLRIFLPFDSPDWESIKVIKS